MKLSSLNKDEDMVHHKGLMQEIRKKCMQRQKSASTMAKAWTLSQYSIWPHQGVVIRTEPCQGIHRIS
jgi:hypothetical protein